GQPDDHHVVPQVDVGIVAGGLGQPADGVNEGHTGRKGAGVEADVTALEERAPPEIADSRVELVRRDPRRHGAPGPAARVRSAADAIIAASSSGRLSCGQCPVGRSTYSTSSNLRNS